MLKNARSPFSLKRSEFRCVGFAIPNSTDSSCFSTLNRTTLN